MHVSSKIQHIAAAEAVINDPQHADRFISIAEAVQILFDALERAHINLFG